MKKMMIEIGVCPVSVIVFVHREDHDRTYGFEGNLIVANNHVYN